ncbi:sensor histidine kinase [Streptomyces sp. 8L]|uniref:sensor histidine kinase n=1 Tax=Streptomyces sp. 8L TaxID=2877242 RepID=UPI001CD2F3F2|nr:GAF domain-containing protein [Streptomyces sp. 8L]MCA1221224.1 GAF domain-containing protein [Streptomyces sp. 8L]
MTGENHRSGVPGGPGRRKEGGKQAPAAPGGGTGLLDAMLTVGKGLELPHVLHRIVETAVDLVDAEYGALGVIGENQQLTQFITVGLSADEYDAIGRLPTGHGLLGELIRYPRTLRLNDLAQHPSASGFPPNHPPMHSFLGVPIKVRDEVYGNLYLTEKRGRGDFEEEDEALLATLANAAGTAIENARLYEQSRYQRNWLETNADIVAELLSGSDDTDVLALMLDRARSILDADLGAVALPLPHSDDLHVLLASGIAAEDHQGLVLPRKGSFMGSAIGARAPLTSTDVEHDPRVTAGRARWAGLGPAVAVPMGSGECPRGVIMLARAARHPGFTRVETEPLMAFAGQAALAMELAERRREAEQITLLRDHDRIAKDLHDLAIQRLFAIGMTVQSAMRFVDHEEATERLGRSVDDLDETIKIIRSTIFGLRSPDARRRTGLRARTAALVEKAATTVGFMPALRMEGLIDTDVSARVADNAVAVLSEALTNVARHAHASSVELSLTVRAGTLTLTVKDDGIGMRHPEHRSGLRNMADRANELHGRMTVDTAPGKGTRLVWRVPAMRE